MKMWLWIITGVVCPLNSGCLNPITDRLDSVSTELTRVNTQLAETNQQLVQANTRLDKIEASMRRMNGN